jgi:hypothetical protein
MLTPYTADRRYQVFISSTFADLADERKAAVEAVFERGHIPIALERFSPANASDLEVIRRAMGESQVYLLILGHRYGELVPGTDRSFTEYEYDIAQEHGLLTLIFQLEKTEISRRRQLLDPNRVSDRAELAHYERLERFHSRISRQFRRLFVPGPHFKYIVQLALSDNLSQLTKPGFIREPADPRLLEGAQNEFIVELVAELTEFERVYQRAATGGEKKRALARYFVQQYMDKILRRKVSLFFQAGSTAAFLAKEMSRALSQHVTLTESGEPSIQIVTNDVVAYLLLWLKARVPCTQFPLGPPSESLGSRYGAAYGGLEAIVDRNPDYRMPPLDESARREIARLASTPLTLTAMKRPALLLSGASGVQISPRHKLTFPNGVEGMAGAMQTSLRDEISRCFGPHVGDYRRKLFLRFMYASRIPIVMFLTGDAINCEIHVGKSHFVLDSELTWEDFYTTYPLAFCVACAYEERRLIVESFESLRFDVVEEDAALPVCCFMARNSVFMQEIEAV